MKDTNHAEVLLQGIVGNPHHAYLLSGQGAESCALSAAQRLLCMDQQAPCGHCKGCAMLAGGTHPDFWSLEDENPLEPQPIKVMQIRELIDWTGLAAQFGQHKVIYIPDAQRMNEAAQNALLRTLEEPPAGVVFLLTGQESALLPTLRSRLAPVRLGQPALLSPQHAELEHTARDLLSLLWTDQAALLPARYAEHKGDLQALLSLQAEILRDAIALRCGAPLLQGERRAWLDTKKALPTAWLQRWTQSLLDATERLSQHAHALMTIDRLCIEWMQVTRL